MFFSKSINLDIAEKYPQIEQRFSLSPIPETILKIRLLTSFFL
jgi:hypothetical protein